MSDTPVIREKIIDVIHGIDPDLRSAHIIDSTSLADLNIDSLRLIELGVLLEDRFGVHMRLDEWIDQERGRPDTPYSLGSLVSFVSKATAAHA
jgi:acyl carrier protein